MTITTTSPELSPVLLAQVALTTIPTVVYTVPPVKAVLVQKMVLANTTLDFIDVYVSLVPFANVGDETNRIMHDVPIPPEGLVAFDMMQVCVGGVSAYAEADGLTLTVSGSLFDIEPGTWNAAGVTWNSAGISWNNWVGMVPWDAQPIGKTWDSLAAGVTWDNYA